MTLVAGIDSSTQSCTVVVRDLDTGQIVRTGRAAHPAGTEVDPNAWWDALLAAIDDAGGFKGVSAFSVAAQQHGMIVLDIEGRIIRPALLWNDTRSAQAAKDLIAEIGAAEYAKRAGSVPVASFTVAKVRWLRDNEPENAARVEAVVLPHDWLIWRLRGYGPVDKSVNGPRMEELVTDRSDASGTGYWSPTTGRYDRELFERALGHPAMLPRIMKPSAWGGESAKFAAHGIQTARIIGVGAGDNAAAALGLGVEPGDIVISLGTSGTVFAVTDTPTADATGTVCGFADAAGAFLPLVATLNAARVLDSVASLLGVDHTELGRLALEAEPGSGGLVLKPYFDGERTPNLPDATASLFGLTLASTTRQNLARAAIEGMLCGLADGLDALRALGIEAQRILLIGGAAQNTAVASIAGQVFDVPVEVPAPAEYVALGATVQAAWALKNARPSWPIQFSAPPAHDPRAIIRQQYAAH
jgi:xylulokinase